MTQPNDDYSLGLVMALSLLAFAFVLAAVFAIVTFAPKPSPGMFGRPAQIGEGR